MTVPLAPALDDIRSVPGDEETLDRVAGRRYGP
jgi:hypothetical protein